MKSYSVRFLLQIFHFLFSIGRMIQWTSRALSRVLLPFWRKVLLPVIVLCYLAAKKLRNRFEQSGISIPRFTTIVMNKRGWMQATVLAMSLLWSRKTGAGAAGAGSG